MDKSDAEIKAREYPTNLLTTSNGTRLFETILAVAPYPVFQQLWSVYFVGKIGKFAGHPYANFTVAKGVSRLDAEEVEGVIRECKAVSGARGLISESEDKRVDHYADRQKLLERACYKR